MYIQQIEIDNFKSFAEKTVIPFRKGFTTVSGPNGSGKSNIIDSILFCLGLSSSRTMRAEKLTDLINNLSHRKEARVTITFCREKEALDTPSQQEVAPVNDDASTPPDAPVANTLTVSRRIKTGPNGYSSTYYLNGEPKTLTEVHDVLSRYHVSPGSFNVMMQGDVAGFVSMSGVERRKIIDEIAGVAEFDRKIEQAEKELEATAANVERHHILLAEIENRLVQLAEERNHALKYQALRDEKQQQEAILLSAHFLDLQKSLAATQENLAKAQQEKTTTRTTLDGLLASLQQTRDQLKALTEEVKRKGEDQQIAIKKQIEGFKGVIARKQDALESIDQKHQENARSIERMQTEIERQTEKLQAIALELEGFEHQAKELKSLYDSEAGVYETLNRRFDQITDATGEVSTRRSDVRNQLETEEDKLKALSRKKLDLEAEQNRMVAEQEMMSKLKAGQSEQYETLLERQQSLESQCKTTRLEKEAFEVQLKHLQETCTRQRVELNQSVMNLQSLTRQYVQMEAKQKAYDEVHFVRSVETILDADMDGVYGTIAQLGRVDTPYQIALETALGGRIQNVVVKDDRVAKRAIEYLQERRAGRATFLPLNKIDASRGLPPLPRKAGVVDFALNLIEFDNVYAAVFAYALSDTLVVETLDHARGLLKQYRMVTLEGSLLERSGAMTGGSLPDSQRGARYFSKTSGASDTQLLDLKNQLDEAEILKERLEKQLTQKELQLETVKSQYNTCCQTLSRLEGELESIAESLEAQRKTLSSDGLETNAADQKAVQKKLQAIASEIKSLDKAMATQQEMLEGIQAQLSDVEAQIPAEEMAQLRKEMTDVKFQMDYYDTQLRNVQADIQGKGMEQNYLKVGIQEFENRIAETHTSTETLNAEKPGILEEIKITQQQIKDLEAQTSELDEELKKLQAERDAVQNELIAEENRRSGLERELVRLDELMAAAKARIRELTPQLEEAKEALVQAGVEADTLKEADLPPEETVRKNIQRLSGKMEAMEPVNMLAIQTFDEESTRKNDLSERLDTLARERETITERISGYESLKCSSFFKAYQEIDQNFKRIFSELADGEGRLTLTNPEMPFEGGMNLEAQPRGKKMQRVESMSGGEKSLTSLAFVFSLQQYLPAPFYALDEVDMNLDGVNVEKLAQMVKRESANAQFVVVSLRKPMLELSDRTIGVTQKRNGITKVTGVKLREERRFDIAADTVTDTSISSQAVDETEQLIAETMGEMRETGDIRDIQQPASKTVAKNLSKTLQQQKKKASTDSAKPSDKAAKAGKPKRAKHA